MVQTSGPAYQYQETLRLRSLTKSLKSAVSPLINSFPAAYLPFVFPSVTCSSFRLPSCIPLLPTRRRDGCKPANWRAVRFLHCNGSQQAHERRWLLDDHRQTWRKKGGDTIIFPACTHLHVCVLYICVLCVQIRVNSFTGGSILTHNHPPLLPGPGSHSGL